MENKIGALEKTRLAIKSITLKEWAFDILIPSKRDVVILAGAAVAGGIGRIFIV